MDKVSNRNYFGMQSRVRCVVFVFANTKFKTIFTHNNAVSVWDKRHYVMSLRIVSQTCKHDTADGRVELLYFSMEKYI